MAIKQPILLLGDIFFKIQKPKAEEKIVICLKGV